MPRKPPVKKPAYIARLVRALRDELTSLHIEPTDVLAQAVTGTRLFRFRVVAPKFSKLRHSERQDLVWRVVRRELGDDEQMRVSTITTLTPSEADGEG